MSQRVLVTGGAGFIGRHVVARLLREGHWVRVLDSLHPQVHGEGRRLDPLLEGAETIVGDLRDAEAVERALRGIDAVVHLAADVGVGQSMYEIERFVSNNELGTAVLFQALSRSPVERVVAASSMSVYGEGLYRDADGNPVESARRKAAVPHPMAGWEPPDADGRPLAPLPTPESKRVQLTSVYALNKYAQEQMTLILGPAYGMKVAALRLFNVYGPGQSLSNPYTGVLAIFSSRLLNRQRPPVFEDGLQRRDFVHVSDVARAFALALQSERAAGEVVNIGSGTSRSIGELAVELAVLLGRPEIEPEIAGKGRVGDIRHCFADIAKARALLGYEPRVRFEDGLAELAAWAATQTPIDRTEAARRELEKMGLLS